ncbi:MAG TPA: hypothetical protein VNZ45_11975, partial [Bacteroidia bacterium]|nr:hypothetical protein [Bacteroidia bacterium]
MKKLQLLLLLIPGLLIAAKSYSQLSGAYTIGGISPNYNTFDAAINDLFAKGVSGPVVFNLRPGTYIDSADCPYVSGTSPINTVTFQAENLDSSSVIIKAPRNWSNLFNSINRDYYNMNELTYYENDSNYAIWMENLNISNCVIDAPNTSGIIIDYGSASIKNSVITCETDVDYITLAPAVITGNTFNGSLQIAYDSSVIFRHNMVYNHTWNQIEFLYGYWDTVEYNNFYGQCQFNFWTDPSVIRFNNFSFPQDSGMAFQIFVVPNPIVSNNTISGSISVSSAGSPTFTGNRISKGTCDIEGEHSFISNNYIVQAFYAGGDTDQIYNNNFSPPGFLYLYGNFCSVKNNNFPAGVTTYYSGDTIIHNNYYPTASLNDPAQTNYDPQYPDSINIHTENPHLIAKGVYLSQVKYDINNISRNNPPTIGADELCIPSNDTLSLACGDSVNLYMCNAPASGNFTWTPSTGLNNPNIAAPSASPSVSTM